jgi:hypothetical protein
MGTLPHAILDNIIIKSISGQLSTMKRLIWSPDTQGLIMPFLDSLYGDRLGINLFHNRIIGKETRDLLGDLLNLIVIPSGEKSLTSFVERYSIVHPEYQIFKLSKDETRTYDEIMRDSSR